MGFPHEPIEQVVYSNFKFELTCTKRNVKIQTGEDLSKEIAAGTVSLSHAFKICYSNFQFELTMTMTCPINVYVKETL